MKISVTYKGILKIAAPIMLSGLAQNIINVTDTAFLSRLGQGDLGAGAIGGLCYLMLVMLGFGLGVGTQILIARRAGEERFHDVGNIFRHSLFLMFILGVALFFVLKFFVPILLSHIIDSPEVLEKATTYLKWRAWGIAFGELSFAFRFLNTGLSRTRVLSYNTFFLALVNAVCAYALIFGKFGFAPHGIAGAGIAAVIAEFMSLVFFVTYTFVGMDWRRYNLFANFRPQRKLLRTLLTLSLPMVCLYFVSLGGWFAFFVIVEKLGETSLAISNIIRSIYIVYFIPIMAFQATTNTMVSHLIGEDRSEDVTRLIRKIIHLSLGFACVASLINFCFPRLIFSLYTTDETMIAQSIPTLHVISLALVLFSVATVLFNAVSGTGDTRASMIIEMTGVTTYLIYTVLTALVFKTRIEVVWCAEWAYWTVLGSLSYARLKTGNWRLLKI